MRKYIFLSLCNLILLVTSSAQNSADALRYSTLHRTGTARFVATGGALGPLGTDFSVLSTNPAGIAWARNSEFTVSPGFSLHSIDSRLTNGASSNAAFDDSDANFVLPAVGVIVASRPLSKNLSTFNFGLGINRINDFNDNFFYRGLSQGSIVDRFVELANSTGLDDFEAGLAFDADALLEDDMGFFSDFSAFPEAVIEREQMVKRRGSVNELSFAFAGNIREKVLWGASIGVPILSYDEEKEYSETDVSGEVDFFNSLSFTERLNTTGQGINLKLGMIVRLTSSAQVGLAVHTPTFYRLQDNFGTSMVYNYTFDNQDNQGRATSPDGNFEYNLRTPWRLLGGFSYLLNRKGSINAEIEYVNYRSASFGFEGFPDQENNINENIEDNLQSSLQFRIGGEYAPDIFRLRGGVGLQKAGVFGDDSYYSHFSLGAGIRKERFAIDAAWQYSSRQETYTPYLTLSENQQIVNNNLKRNLILLSLSFFF